MLEPPHFSFQRKIEKIEVYPFVLISLVRDCCKTSQLYSFILHSEFYFENKIQLGKCVLLLTFVKNTMITNDGELETYLSRLVNA